MLRRVVIFAYGGGGFHEADGIWRVQIGKDKFAGDAKVTSIYQLYCYATHDLLKNSPEA